MNADLDDLNEVVAVAGVSKVNSNRPPIGKPPKSQKDVRKSIEASQAAGVIAKIKSEAEKSKIFLEKQAMLEEKRK